MTLTSEKLKFFFKTTMYLDNTEDLRADTALFSTGMLDSLQLISLVSFIESEADITIKPMEVSLHNLDSIKKILEFINQKKNLAS